MNGSADDRAKLPPGVVRLSLWGAAACALTATASWLLTSIPEIAVQSDPQDWRLPALPDTLPKSSWAALAERNIWGAAATGAVKPSGPAAPLTPPDWRILASVVTATDRVAIIRVGAEPPQELRVGEQLPGGAIIRAIEPDRLVVQIGGQRRILRLPPR